MQLPAQPNSWFLVGRVADLRRGPRGIELPDRRLVAFRTASGRVGVLDARCAHFGADLSAGEVCGEALHCPYHSWSYDIAGRCVGVPCGDVPRFARQRAYPVEVRHGLVYAFRGDRPAFPLPFFEGDEPNDFVAARPLQFTAECEWTFIAANGFDCHHLAPVHGRAMISEPKVDSPHPFARRIRYYTRVTGTSVFDRLLRRFVGETVAVSITSWAGGIVVVRAEFRRIVSRVFITIRPFRDHTLFDAVAYAPRGVAGRLSLPLRRRFTRAFVEGDTHKLRGPRFNPHRLVAADRPLADYYDWLLTLHDAPDIGARVSP